MKFKTIAIILSATAILAACNGENTNKEKIAVTKENTTINNETTDIKQLVSDFSSRNIKAESASINSKQLIVTDDNKKETVYELPKNEFFVSISPYIKETHPCKTHSLTGCQGELVNKEFNVYIEDKDGNVVMNKALKSQANGFIDLWLQRNQTYRIKIEHKGKMVESKFSTFEKDGTCISTMQLK